MKIPLDDQIAEVARECALRKNVYAMWIAKGRLDQDSADRQLGRMEAALNTLIWLRNNRAAVVEGANV